MKRILTIVSILSLVMVSGAMAQENYGWSLSGSSSDPSVSTGVALGAVPFFVYLWLDCTADDGISAAEFSLATNYFNAGFTPLGGSLNAGDGTNLLLAVGGCPSADYVMGQWQFLDFTGLGGNACLVPSPGGVNASVDCDTLNPQVWPNAIIGYSTDGTAPCVTGTCSDIVSVENSSWGSIKTLYR